MNKALARHTVNSPTDTGPGAQGAGSERNFCRVMVVRGAHFGDQFLVPKKVPVFGPRFWALIKNIWEDQKKGPKTRPFLVPKSGPLFGQLWWKKSANASNHEPQMDR